MRLAEAIRAKRVVELQNGRFGFEDGFKLDTNFLDYYRAMTQERLGGKVGADCPLSAEKYDPFRRNRIDPRRRNKNDPCRNTPQGIFCSFRNPSPVNETSVN